MNNSMRVAINVLRFRAGPTQWAWAVHRVAGIGVYLFLALHIVDIFVAAFGAAAFNDLVFLYKGPPARVLEILLAFGLLYHGLNGLRIVATDFKPNLATGVTARRLYYLELVVFVALFIPASYFMMWTLPQQPFHHNAAISFVVTLVILLLPAAVVVGGRNLLATTLLAADVTGTSADDPLNKTLRGRQPRQGSTFERNVWLFMRISGVLLIVLALFHMFWLHFVISVEEITFNTLVQRWNDPVNPLLSLFWRTYDFALLIFAFTHGTLGANYVLSDYARNSKSRRLLQTGLAVFWVLLLLMGAGIIFFFKGTLQ